MRNATMCLGAAALALMAVEVQAQQTPTRRQAPIEITGTVPTPQVVTVRPREVPAYSRKVLVPNFYDHDFWPSILPAYEMVPERRLSGEVPMDSAMMRRDTLGAAGTMQRDSLGRLVPGRARIDSMRVRPDSLMRMMPDTSVRARPDTTRALPPVPPPAAPTSEPLAFLVNEGLRAAGTPSASSSRQ